MDNRETLSLLRWMENAEIEVAEHARLRDVSRRSAELEIVVNAQLVAARQRLAIAREVSVA